MPYLNIDDKIDEHPKVELLSDAAYRLWKTSLSYCSRNLTDGVVTLARARRLTATGTDVVAHEIVVAGLWHDLGEGCGTDTCLAGVKGAYVVHDYLQWNHSAHWWAERRKKDQERQAEWRAKKGLPPKKQR